ncbi:hypothetical protein VL14_16505 [Cytobacillus firmus]|jgi:hypothetical protein|nr:hypothetical protein VL14_16505 [Cytobacillus firmus]
MNYLPELSLSTCTAVIAVDGLSVILKEWRTFVLNLGGTAQNDHASLHNCRGAFCLVKTVNALKITVDKEDIR